MHISLYRFKDLHFLVGWCSNFLFTIFLSGIEAKTNKHNFCVIIFSQHQHNQGLESASEWIVYCWFQKFPFWWFGSQKWIWSVTWQWSIVNSHGGLSRNKHMCIGVKMKKLNQQLGTSNSLLFIWSLNDPFLHCVLMVVMRLSIVDDLFILWQCSFPPLY